MSEKTKPTHLDEARVVYQPDGMVVKLPVTPDFYSELDQRFGAFTGHSLIQQFTFDKPWGSWEMHPCGDEFVYLLQGDATFVLWIEGKRREARLHESGTYVIVPKGVWHTAETETTTTLLFVTPGEGTQHAEAPPT